MNQQDNKCACCGAVQEGNLKFIIGAKSDNPHSKDDWVLVHGSGRLFCAECYPDELVRGKEITEKYIARFNAQSRAI